MQNTETVQTRHWIIELPDDWIEQGETDEGALYFESADGAKGFYISTWDLSGDVSSYTAADVAESFRQAELDSLREMDGYSWKTLTDHSTQTEAGAIVVTDHFAGEKSYRIAGKILSAPPIVVRAAFHDYACTDYEASVAYFAPIIASLRLCEPEG